MKCMNNKRLFTYFIIKILCHLRNNSGHTRLRVLQLIQRWNIITLDTKSNKKETYGVKTNNMIYLRNLNWKNSLLHSHLKEIIQSESRENASKRSVSFRHFPVIVIIIILLAWRCFWLVLEWASHLGAPVMEVRQF